MNAELIRNAAARTRHLRKALRQAGIGCTIRTAAATGITTITVFNELSAFRAETGPLADLPARSIRIEVNPHG